MNIAVKNEIHVVTLRRDGDVELNAAVYRAQKAMLRGECAGYKILNKKGEVLASWLIMANVR